MTIFKGSGVAIVTPFKSDGTVDYDSYEKLIEFQLENHTDCIIPCGTTGESATLTDEEQLDVIRFTIEKVNKKVPVVAGAGSNDTNHCIHLVKESARLGADGLLLVTPYYNKTTQKGLVRHYEDIAKETDLPIIVYSVASRTGLNICPQTAQALSKIENIVAIKEASGDISQVAHIAALCGESLDIYSGNDDQIIPLLSLGGKGVISVAANIIPKDIHDLCAKFFAGDLSGSLNLQLKMLNLIKALFCEVNPLPVKEALNLMGKNGGIHRAPLYEMEEENKNLLKKELKAYGLL